MIFVAMKEDAFVFIEAPTYFDAKQFASAELESGDDPIVVEPASDRVRPDVSLKWIGSDTGSNPKRMVVSRRLDERRVTPWRSVSEDRRRWDKVRSKEGRPADFRKIELIIGTKPEVPATVLPGWSGPAALDASRLEANLTATQARCSTLLDEARFARRERDAWFEAVLRLIGLSETGRRSRLGKVMVDFMIERGRQDAKWGPIGAKVAPQNALGIPFGTGGPDSKGLAEEAKASCDAAFKRGDGTWADVLKEELAEVLAETDPVKLRNELVQLGAVCVKCVEILDWKDGA